MLQYDSLLKVHCNHVIWAFRAIILSYSLRVYHKTPKKAMVFNDYTKFGYLFIHLNVVKEGLFFLQMAIRRVLVLIQVRLAALAADKHTPAATEQKA